MRHLKTLNIYIFSFVHAVVVKKKHVILKTENTRMLKSDRHWFTKKAFQRGHQLSSAQRGSISSCVDYVGTRKPEHSFLYSLRNLFLFHLGMSYYFWKGRESFCKKFMPVNNDTIAFKNSVHLKIFRI